MKKVFEEPRFDVLVFGREDIVACISDGVDQGSSSGGDIPVLDDDDS